MVATKTYQLPGNTNDNGPIIFKYTRVQDAFFPDQETKRTQMRLTKYMPSLNHHTFMTQPDPRTWRIQGERTQTPLKLFFTRK